MTTTLKRAANFGALALIAALATAGSLHAQTPTAGAAGAGATAAGAPVKLQSVDVQTLPGNQVQLKLHLSGAAPQPLPFTIDKPARIAFDLPNTSLALPSRRIDVRSGGVDTVVAAEANGRTRVVVNVAELLPYTAEVQGNDILLTLGSKPGDSVAARSAPAAAASADRVI